MFHSPFACISAVRTNVTIPIFPIRYYMDCNTAYFVKDPMEQHMAAWFWTFYFELNQIKRILIKNLRNQTNA